MLRLWFCVLSWSYSTVDWTRWRHRITAQRGPSSRSCIWPHTC